MNKNLGILLILFLGLALIGAIVYFVFFANLQSDSVQTFDIDAGVNQNTANDTSSQVNNQDNEPVVHKIEKKEEEGNNTSKVVSSEKTTVEAVVTASVLERMASSFAERFGSFSNQSNYSNVLDLRMFMTEKMKAWAENYVEKNKKNSVASDIYFGVTTKAVSSNTETFDEDKGEAIILVKTRRREATGTTNNSSKIYNQDILISFVKEDEAWKVDSAYWQN